MNGVWAAIWTSWLLVTTRALEIRGISFGTPPWGNPLVTTASNSSLESLKALASTGATWVQLMPTSYLRYSQDDAVVLVQPSTDRLTVATLDQLSLVAKEAQKLGLKVLVSSHIVPDWSSNTTGCRGPGTLRHTHHPAHNTTDCQTQSGYASSLGCLPVWSELTFQSFFSALEGALSDVIMAFGDTIDMLSIADGLDCIVDQGPPTEWGRLLQTIKSKAGTTPLMIGLGRPSQASWLGSDSLYALGLSAAVPLRTPYAQANSSTLLEAWQPFLMAAQSLSTLHGNKPILFHRVGYQSRCVLSTWRR